MGKYLVLWEMDESGLPVDPRERATAWKAGMGLVKQGLKTGTSKDWGAFVGEHRGYSIHEGTEVEVGASLQQYVPGTRFTVYPVATVDQVDEMIDRLLE